MPSYSTRGAGGIYGEYREIKQSIETIINRLDDPCGQNNYWFDDIEQDKNDLESGISELQNLKASFETMLRVNEYHEQTKSKYENAIKDIGWLIGSCKNTLENVKRLEGY